MRPTCKFGDLPHQISEFCFDFQKSASHPSKGKFQVQIPLIGHTRIRRATVCMHLHIAHRVVRARVRVCELSRRVENC